MEEASRLYYQKLYMAEHVDPEAIQVLLQTIPHSDQLEPEAAHRLLQPITLEELQGGAGRSPRHSSPGMDGLPYEILSLLFHMAPIGEIATSVYNAALHEGIFPDSWHDTCVTLLPKKGDLTSLSNWRPISLINTDAKVLTRIIANRLKPACGSLICSIQTGFLPGRFIGDNGMILNTILADAALHEDKGVGLLLDQEKAYDRVHPEYLTKVLLRFGFPNTLVQTLRNLFLNTRIAVNINGHVSRAIHQGRGLRQGDPLSPLLYNLALDPFLRSIAQHDSFLGYSLHRHDATRTGPLPTPPRIKVLAYADDTAVFPQNHTDFEILQDLLEVYSRASNAKLNLSSTKHSLSWKTINILDLIPGSIWYYFVA